MDRTGAARGAVVAGIATVAITGWFLSQGAVACEGGDPVSSAAALGAFQSAKSQVRLDLAIGCIERLAVLDRMNRVDLIAYIASYGLLMVLGALALARGRHLRFALLFIAVALIGDVLETATQLWIGTLWPFTTTPMLQYLAAGNAMKWAGIALGLGAIGGGLAGTARGATRWLGVAISAMGAASLAVFVLPATPPFAGIGFLLLIGACALNVRRGRAPDSPPTASR